MNSTRIVDVHKKDNLFVSVHTSAPLVKPAQPVEPIFSTPTLLMGALLATPEEPASNS